MKHFEHINKYANSSKLQNVVHPKTVKLKTFRYIDGTTKKSVHYDLSIFIFIQQTRGRKSKEMKKYKEVAERSFDLRTSGLWAQHASTAPLCFAF